VAERWSVVTEAEALSCAGAQAQTLPAGDVMYVVGPSATLVIVRADGGAVQSFDGLVLREPFPEAVEARLTRSKIPLLGFVRLTEGYLPLGELRQAVSHCRSVEVDGRPWPSGGRAELTWCELRIVDRLPFDVLDRVRPTPQEPLPSLDWLRFLPDDPIVALRGYVAGWYADIPPGDEKPGDPDRALPEVRRQKKLVLHDRRPVPATGRRKGNELLMRLGKGRCELCEQRSEVRVHQVSKLADLTKPGSPQPPWVQLMARMRRKTLIVCPACHDTIHNRHPANTLT
jgi:hypothetical protein